jgi:hypothetical protein
MGDLLTRKAPYDMDNGVYFPNLPKELIPQSLTVMRPLNEPGNVNNPECSGYDSLGLEYFRQFIETVV